MKASDHTYCTFLTLTRAHRAVKDSILKTCNFPCRSRVLFMTVMDFTACVSPCNFTKAALRRRVCVQQLMNGMTWSPAAIRGASFNCDIFHLKKVSELSFTGENSNNKNPLMIRVKCGVIGSLHSVWSWSRAGEGVQTNGAAFGAGCGSWRWRHTLHSYYYVLVLERRSKTPTQISIHPSVWAPHQY